MYHRHLKHSFIADFVVLSINLYCLTEDWIKRTRELQVTLALIFFTNFFSSFSLSSILE
jgi:hypothetical protein